MLQPNEAQTILIFINVNHILISSFSLPWIPFEYHQNMSGATKDITAEIWAYATTLWEIFSHGRRPTLKEFYASKRRLPRPRDCPEDMYEIMKEGWHESPDRRFTPQAVFSKLFLARKSYFQIENNAFYLSFRV